MVRAEEQKKQEGDSVLPRDEHGFSLIELLSVVAIFAILAGISLITWQSFAPMIALNSSAQALANHLELAMSKALSQHNNWFILLNYDQRTYITTDNQIYHFPKNSYVVVNDDGWLAPPGGKRQYNLITFAGGSSPEFSEEYDPETGNFRTQKRNNDLIEAHEIFKGPLKLGRGVVFQYPPDNSPSVRRVVFTYRSPFMYWQSDRTSSNRPIAKSERITTPARIYLSDMYYKIGDSSKDNYAHLRLIKVYSSKVKIIRLN